MKEEDEAAEGRSITDAGVDRVSCNHGKLMKLLRRNH